MGDPNLDPAAAPSASPGDGALLTTHRPHPRLLKAYLVRSLLTGPLLLIVLPVRYTFDDEGIAMRWGILFRREVNLAYTRIQDIHLTSGPLLRWLGLADIHIQTAAGSASAEMKVEGLPHYEAVREFLYTRMRGHAEADRAAPGAGSEEDAPDLVRALGELRDELRGARIALEQLSQEKADRPDR